MPRRARLSIPGVPHHVIQRGNNRSACFYADADYARYLCHLKEFAERFDCAVHAYALMTNHVHLLLTPGDEGNVSQLMKYLGQRYVQYINRVYQRTGTLWEGRFRSCLVQTEEYLLACYRYIELNPVRAGMVAQPERYRWSSYRVNALGSRSDLVKPHEQYMRIGGNDTVRRDRYRMLFSTTLRPEVLDEIRRAENGNFALGNDRFRKEIEETTGRKASPGTPGRPKRKKEIDTLDI